ncbi:hypothetical protein ACLOJK_009850 [Asimina triloba]
MGGRSKVEMQLIRIRGDIEAFLRANNAGSEGHEGEPDCAEEEMQGAGDLEVAAQEDEELELAHPQHSGDGLM